MDKMTYRPDLSVGSQFECPAVDREEQALQVGKLRSRQAQQTSGIVLDTTSGTLIPRECICTARRQTHLQIIGWLNLTGRKEGESGSGIDDTGSRGENRCRRSVADSLVNSPVAKVST